MTISEKNIVKRWNMMASKDLGFDRNSEARGFAEFFRSIFEDGNTQPRGYRCINPIIRGFAFNNRDLEIGVVECLDLNYINITKKAAMELDWYLMNSLDWFDRYQYALAN
ncbi:hypothetical protein AALB52_18425 [Lachnospiraceae bacterium 38-14]|uniref:hypothetical protein n=1 Tax=Roseburia sp. 1XD42-69 TaxID=2320088 RepID=UPI000EA1451F|nr:hypothetical protein [Roseburia sp. 1XD42-69]RKJ64828.1 hypothetical protein D7Y06_11035 [Roseburia sp. 1XD42-69]